MPRKPGRPRSGRPWKANLPWRLDGELVAAVRDVAARHNLAPSALHEGMLRYALRLVAHRTLDAEELAGQ